jgi:Arylsulfotransferase (ASST)
MLFTTSVANGAFDLHKSCLMERPYQWLVMRRPGERAWLRPVAVGAILLVFVVASCSSAKHAATEQGVDGAKVSSVAVYPLAGTPDASRGSEISFRGIEPAKLTRVAVVGSKSGRHAGRLAPHSDGMGASFVPVKRFAPGETVRVRANVPLVGARKGVVTFRIARLPGRLEPQKVFPDGTNPTVKGTNHYLSRPDLRPPRIKVKTSRHGASTDYIFLAPKSGPGQDGPLILDHRGLTVWFHPQQPGFKTYDFRAATYEGKPVVTWWQGKGSGEYGGGTGVIADSSYRVIATVKGGNGYPTDIHEFRVTPQGTALIIAYRAVPWDVRPLGGPRGKPILDSIALEIDIKTGHVLFEWHSLGHIPLKDSYAHYRRPTRPVDYTHLDSVALDDDGNFLISARNTWAVYKVDRRTGRILWRLGGKRSSFKLPKYAQFVGPHDFERAPDGRYTLFDNANINPPPHWMSRGLVFAIHEHAHTARLVKVLRQPQGRGTTTQGSVQVLPDGHYVVGWGGGIPDVSEFSAEGKLLFDARVMASAESYRVYRFPWSAHPRRPPDVRVRRKAGRTVAYVSWNGATDVTDWQVLAGSSRDSLAAAARAKKRGFETPISLPGPARFVAVKALSDSGTVLATSKTVGSGKGLGINDHASDKEASRSRTTSPSTSATWVDDVHAAVSFYTTHLGFSLINRSSAPFSVTKSSRFGLIEPLTDAIGRSLTDSAFGDRHFTASHRNLHRRGERDLGTNVRRDVSSRF